MIVDKGEYYLYRHIRLDNNQVFYIGVGSKEPRKKSYSSYTMEYRRAFRKDKREQIWKNVINKTEYLVEILIESTDYNFILQKEIEFIKLYGKVKDKNGTLVNIAEGGGGIPRHILSKEHKDNIRLNSKSCKAIVQLNKDNEPIREWKSISEASRELNFNLHNIEHCLKGKNTNNNRKTAHGFKWKYKNELC